MKLVGTRTLVIGGARHLGRLLAADLANAGACVALTSRDGTAATRVAESLGGPPRAIGLSADTGTATGAREAVAAARRALSGLDALVYAASGPFMPTPPDQIDEAAWDLSFNVIARGFFFAACAARNVMIEPAGRNVMIEPAGRNVMIEPAGRNGETPVSSEHGRSPVSRGTIVAITDYLGSQPCAAFAAHGAAKAAQIHLVKELARAWAADGVRVCGVAPGPVDLDDDDHRAATLRAAAKTGEGRLVTPGEICAAVRLCLEDEGMTGVNVVVDGGALLTS